MTGLLVKGSGFSLLMKERGLILDVKMEQLSP